jgi:diguanylate cyclase (GGDEF)-like protein/PAS domain S-box-containing protein
MAEKVIRVLLIDDDEDDYLLTKDLFTEIELGQYELEWSSDYQISLNLITQNKHDVYLVDYRLGAYNGLDLMRSALAEGCAAPFILLTGLGDHEIDLEAMKSGAADYLVKGQIKASLLERSIRYALERAKNLKALKENEERYALAAMGANDGLWDWDLQTNAIYYSPRWAEMLGYKSSELSNSPEEWYKHVTLQDRETLKSSIKKYIDSHITHFQTEYRVNHRNGGQRWMLCRGLILRDKNGNAYRLAGSQTDITDRRLAENQLIYAALHDTLTRLPNRTYFMDILKRSMKNIVRNVHYKLAVLFMDVDRFKHINDCLGHLVGDQTLVEIGRTLKSCIRPNDTVARLAGDEFIILMENINEVHDAVVLAERILKNLSQPISIGAHEIYTSVSIGIAMNTGKDETAEELIRNADTAMYCAKSQGKARSMVFDETMKIEALEQIQLEADLRRAVEKKEFILYYQPIISLIDGAIAGFEAVLRWQHPEKGLVYPDEFIPIIEETNLILPVSEWALYEACEQIRKWQSVIKNKLIYMCVNLSIKQFLQTNFIESIEHIIKETRISSENLCLEITEGMIMGTPQATASILFRIKDLKVQLYLDDFGTGYSSLSYLHHFPISTIKIDKSFIQRLVQSDEDSLIVEAIINLGKNLKKDVIAEGVETLEQLERLIAYGCPKVQGFYFSKPIPAAEIEEFFLKKDKYYMLDTAETQPLKKNKKHDKDQKS